MTNFSPNFYQLFVNFPIYFYVLCNINLALNFSVLARYRRFSLSTWSKMKNFDPNHKSKIVHFLKMLGENLVIFALDLKLDWATVTLVLTSAPKFLWSVVHFDK